MNEKIPKATHSGMLRLGAVEVPCFVLDGRSVLSQTGVQSALALAKRGARNGVDGIASFMGSNAMAPYSGAALTAWTNRVNFEPPHGGAAATGCDAHVLVEIAGAIDDADRAGALGKRYANIVASARALLRSLAGVAIDALIHEATGYAKVRPDGDLEARFNARMAEQEERHEKRLADQAADFMARLDEKDSIELELLYEREDDGKALASRLASRAHRPRIKIRIRERRAELNDLRDMKRGQARLFKAPVAKPAPSKAGAA